MCLAIIVISMEINKNQQCSFCSRRSTLLDDPGRMPASDAFGDETDGLLWDEENSQKIYE